MSELDATLGAIEIGCLLSVFMFGLFNLQVFRYYRNFPNDSWVLKLMVAFQGTLEITHAVFICHAVYELTITDYMVPEAMSRYPWSLSLSKQIDGLIIFCAETYFITRIYKCIGSPYIPLFCWLLSLLSLIGLTALTVYSMRMPSFYRDHHTFNWLITSSSVIDTVVDVTIAAFLCFYLFKERHKPVPTRIHRIVDQVITATMSTGLAPSVMAIVLVICLHALDSISLVWLAVLMLKAELFSNSMLAHLNNRSVLRPPSSKKTTTRSAQLPSMNFVRGDGDLGIQSIEVALDISNTNSSSADERKDTIKAVDV